MDSIANSIKYIPGQGTELMPVRMPEGWVISMNKLYDTEPKHQPGSKFIENCGEGFMLDVMWIQECLLDSETQRYTVPEYHTWAIDVGWSPDCDINGSYNATLQWIAKEEVVEIDYLATKNRFELRDKLEYWLYDIYLNRTVYRKEMMTKHP